MTNVDFNSDILLDLKLKLFLIYHFIFLGLIFPVAAGFYVFRFRYFLQFQSFGPALALGAWHQLRGRRESE